MNDGWLDSLFKNIGKGLRRTIDTQIMNVLNTPNFIKGFKNIIHPVIMRQYATSLPRYREKPRPVDDPIKLKCFYIHDRIWLNRKWKNFKSTCGRLTDFVIGQRKTRDMD